MFNFLVAERTKPKEKATAATEFLTYPTFLSIRCTTAARTSRTSEDADAIARQKRSMSPIQNVTLFALQCAIQVDPKVVLTSKQNLLLLY